VILHRDADWLFVDKPSGMATHAGKPGELGATEWLELHLGLETHVVSRLDRGTSGVLLLARTPDAAARAQKIHESGQALKTYEFWSTAARDPVEWVCEDPLDGHACRTTFRRTGANPQGDLFRYEASITRGRKHQIRRHAAVGGVPVLGDETYGGTRFGRLCLHCREVAWPGLDKTVRSSTAPSFAALERGDDPGFALCLDRRGKWPMAVTDAWRAVHRDEIDGLPAAVEVYGAWFNAVWFDETSNQAKIERLLHPVLEQVSAAAGLRGGVIRIHRRNPHQKGLHEETVVVGNGPPPRFTVSEHGLKYEISLTETQHPGLFLDQRDTRRLLAMIAGGKRLANLFAYTSSFSVAAAAAEAEVCFSVDNARACLETGKANFAQNGLEETGRGKFIKEDARKWLARQERRRDKDPGAYDFLDLVVCDPPVFASSKDGGRFLLEKEWAGLAGSCSGLMPPGGVAVFANNHRTGDHRFYRKALVDHFSEVTDLRPPLDFPVFPRRLHHVRTFWCLK